MPTYLPFCKVGNMYTTVFCSLANSRQMWEYFLRNEVYLLKKLIWAQCNHLLHVPITFYYFFRLTFNFAVFLDIYVFKIQKISDFSFVSLLPIWLMFCKIILIRIYGFQSGPCYFVCYFLLLFKKKLWYVWAKRKKMLLKYLF